MVLVKPATVVQWHRKGFRLYWRWRSRRLGRPKMSPEIRDLIRRMSLANPLWGAPRIHGELRKIVARKSVVCIIATNVAPPELLWRPNRRTRFGVGGVGLLQLYCSDAMAPEPMHAAQVAAAPNLFDQSKIVSRDLHRQTDSQTGQVFVQDRFLSRDTKDKITARTRSRSRAPRRLVL
jgi:hypothetical protein